jgi:starch-binding outer membrane protein, SusD/RagB family
MPTHTNARPVRLRSARAGRTFRVALVAAGALLGASCASDGILEVEDPDIINPSDVRSAAGANAVRLGAIARLNTATSGAQSLFLLGGLFADEWTNGDTFIARQEVDQRVITAENSFLTTANRDLHQTRLAAEQAVALLTEYAPDAPAWQTAEMYFVEAYVENLATEHYCSGLVFSTVVDGAEQFGEQVTTQAAFERALGNADAGLALLTGTSADDVRVRNALQVIRGRILNNLGRRDEAAAAVAGVPTDFRYEMLHSETTSSNIIWDLNNLNLRYSVSDAEGTNGLDFATAGDPRLPVCEGGDAVCSALGITDETKNDGTSPVYVQLLWPTREAPVAIASGVEARLIEAEAQLATDPVAALGTLNDARATVGGLGPLPDAGSEAARVDQLFRERAFWLFGRGYRTGDLRRLIRQYGRAPETVFPTGEWRPGAEYGEDVTIPVPLAETNNPNVTGDACIDRNA